MSVERIEANHVRTGGSLWQHLAELLDLVGRLEYKYGHEPAEITTSYRSDEEFSGWESVVVWPVKIILERK